MSAMRGLLTRGALTALALRCALSQNASLLKLGGGCVIGIGSVITADVITELFAIKNSFHDLI